MFFILDVLAMIFLMSYIMYHGKKEYDSIYGKE